MNVIKQQIIDEFPDSDLSNLFIPGQDDKLIRYAEIFGCDCILLYKDINTTLYKNSDKAIVNLNKINENARLPYPYESAIEGILKLESGLSVGLMSRDKIIEKIKNDNRSDRSGIYKNEEDIHDSALEHYEYNVLGTYMDGIPAFAVLLIK